jgi:hypothetical protein
VADIKSEPRPASNRNRWPASYWNAWPASSESASIIAQHFKAGEEGGDRDARVSQALSDAKNYTARELPAILNGEKPKPKAHYFHLRLTPRQYKVFAAAMTEFKATPATRGFSDKERAVTVALRLALKARSAATSTGKTRTQR